MDGSAIVVHFHRTATDVHQPHLLALLGSNSAGGFRASDEEWRTVVCRSQHLVKPLTSSAIAAGMLLDEGRETENVVLQKRSGGLPQSLAAFFKKLGGLR